MAGDGLSAAPRHQVQSWQKMACHPTSIFAEVPSVAMQRGALATGLRLTQILVAAGACDFDIAATVPTDQVADAFDELERRHTHGKIVLLPQARTEQTQS